MYRKSTICDVLNKISKCSPDDLSRASDKHEGVIDTDEEQAGYGAREFIHVKGQVQNKITINVILFWA